MIEVCPCGATEVYVCGRVARVLVAPMEGIGITEDRSYVCIACRHPLGAVPASAEALQVKGN